ncbi:hypothetical protein C8R45DRAFT_1101644 [Mycena sanguinolenta]|nr:hypothetical protein C8R45DRAFT_1101644 [Mycena sanguinolenta]
MSRRRGASKRVKPLRGQDRPTHEYVFTQSVAEFLLPQTDAPICTRVEQATLDGRRVQTEVVPVEPPSPVKRQRLADFGSNAEDAASWEPLYFEPEGLNRERYNMELGGFYPRAQSPAHCRRRCAADPFKPSDKSLFEYRPLRDEYLAEFLRLDGCGDASMTSCPACNIGVPTIRCRDCYGGELYCPESCAAAHQHHPLHLVERWEGSFFKPTSLKDLGLRVQLGHAGCLHLQRGREDFVVLDLGHIHNVSIDFCGCTGRPEHRVQLLRWCWFPATHDMPKTAATLRVLEFFHIQTLQGKTTMFDFYTSLEKLTDASGTSLSPPPKRYCEFLRMTRAYRNLLMLKRGGRGHEHGGVNGTKPGELAIECPACPRPGVNLPEGWENAAPERRFLYTLFLALDACFRLKRRLISSDLRDPGLGTGWSYFVETEPYRQYLLTVTDQVEMSTCSGLAALDYANTKFSRGYSATGVGMGVCARHEFVQPNSVGDLQRGERYANMDWIFVCILLHKHELLRKVVSYDIVCQWWKRLVKRLLELPERMRLAIVMALFQFVIPKMHIHSHTLACQLAFSLNWLLGAGQTDDEGIERPRANIGGVASSTREMGPGSRRDVLDDHWAYWNWCKLSSIGGYFCSSIATWGLSGLRTSGALLRKRVDNTRQEREAQTEVFEVFSAEQAECVPAWEKMVQEYEQDQHEPEPDDDEEPGARKKNKGKSPGKKNPYAITNLTEAEVRLKLTEDEQVSAARGVPSLHDISPSAFIYTGLDLEEQQRRVRVQAELKKVGTTAQKIDVLAMCRKLNRGIVRFRKLQATYTPGALQVLWRRTFDPKELPEDTPLMLPSTPTAAERQAGCIAGLHVKSRLLRYKEIHARHQGANTRSRTLVARNESKIRLHSERYQAAWEALRRLRAAGEQEGWCQLRREDVRTMEDAEELSKRQAQRKKKEARRREQVRRLRQEGEPLQEEEADAGSEGDESDDEEGERVADGAENKRQVSWIWIMAGTTGSDAELEDALRIEWTKARARCKRWTEEVALLEEEYRRVLASFEYEALRWEQGAGTVADGTQDGAGRGALTYRNLAAKMTTAWMEIHRGRGCKHIQAPLIAVRPATGDADAAVGSIDAVVMDETLDEGEVGQGMDRDVETDSDSDKRGDVLSDEEFFMGGEAEDD